MRGLEAGHHPVRELLAEAPLLVRAGGPHQLPQAAPPEHRHFRTHEGHYTYIHPGEAELIDADLVRDTCLVGEAEELIERIQELERGGLRELMWASGTDEKWRFSQQLADRVMARL